MRPLTQGSLVGLEHRHLASGKVREMWSVGSDEVLIVATDRISAFDHVLPTEIPDKGAVLTGLSVWWLGSLADVVPHHLVTARVEEFPAELQPHADALRGRSMLCRRLEMLPVECVVRGYLAGSAWASYDAHGTVDGRELVQHLREGDKLSQPLFTPTTKGGATGHDEPLTRTALDQLVGPDVAAELERLSLTLYRRAARLALDRGLIVADTKFEFGRAPSGDGALVLGDEVLTPDSSRLWPADGWRPGGAQPSYDKQPVRDWLAASGWDRVSAPPSLPPDVVAATRDRYVGAYERLTGTSFVPAS